MKIIIVGCGKVGYTLAEQLSEEGHGITIIDNRQDILQMAVERLDVIGMIGNGTSYSVQKEAGIDEADLLIAVTNMDEVNLLCCLIAKKAGNCQTMARVRNPEYYAEIGFIKEELGLSLAINPELSAASDIFHLIQVPSAMELDTFAKGRINMIKFCVEEGSLLCNLKVSEVAQKFTAKLLICVIEREHCVIIPDGNAVLEKNDIISVIIAPEQVNRAFANFGIETKVIKDVMIAGGGMISYYLAARLIEAKIRVKIIEIDKERCEELSDMLPEAIIIHGDASSQSLLLEEGLPHMDAFVALTNYDEENILLSLFSYNTSEAKRITKINKINLGGLLNDIPIGTIVSPKHITSEGIIQYVRSMQNSMGSNVESVYRMLDNRVEALEFSVKEKSRATNVPLCELKVKKELLLCAILRGRQIMIPRGGDSIHVGDTVIVVTTNKGLDDIQDILAD